MTVLTPSPSPSILLSTTPSKTQLLALLSPALSHSLYFAAVVQQTTFSLFLRWYLISAVLLRQLYYATQLLAIQSFYISVLLYRSLKHALRVGWKATEQIRDKLFFEFMVFVLGGGNGLLLILFWPGWLVIGGVFWGVWKVCG